MFGKRGKENKATSPGINTLYCWSCKPSRNYCLVGYVRLLMIDDLRKEKKRGWALLLWINVSYNRFMWLSQKSKLGKGQLIVFLSTVAREWHMLFGSYHCLRCSSRLGELVMLLAWLFSLLNILFQNSCWLDTFYIITKQVMISLLC